jgi:hypothetical protein
MQSNTAMETVQLVTSMIPNARFKKHLGGKIFGKRNSIELLYLHATALQPISDGRQENFADFLERLGSSLPLSCRA